VCRWCVQHCVAEGCSRNRLQQQHSGGRSLVGSACACSWVVGRVNPVEQNGRITDLCAGVSYTSCPWYRDTARRPAAGKQHCSVLHLGIGVCHKLSWRLVIVVGWVLVMVQLAIL
jgi:hypothetical protein